MRDIEWTNLFDPELAVEAFPYILQGMGLTLLISLISMAFGLLLGLLIALARSSNRAVLRWPARLYISFMRGVPILVILFILYFGFPVIGIQFTAILAAIIGFSINSAAYIAEINRSAISSIDKGQWEGAHALNFTYWQTLRRVILPQATRVAIPPLFNVLLDLTKASSLAAMITVPELLHKARVFGAKEFDFMTALIVVAIIYWVVCSAMAFFQDGLEKRFSRYL
ncbi:amino acid ABC transporter permease [Aureibacillus halotolerans]|uniref:Amino acid ABC transporter membrane protein (PAAT family) n=1 Tax=Aureibacillus halotolerans TaxID=1508390 RepID=A0A4R6U821_9BACI|nr:amino acid ABC transporter permease [Aureibacillus halotolerans]TDQ42678.1 amino acid ABC transporter membrane protein (PAAT family) [Aureibacillus halotolerans]